jgi:hypothetical protein
MSIVKRLFSWLTGEQFIMYMGGGGGGPSTTYTNTSNIPEYAQPYVEQMLGSAQKQIFNYNEKGEPTTMKPYTPYSTDPNAYVAGFSPMQQQAFRTVGGMKAGPQGFQQDVGAYMSPYAELALQPQLQAAARQSAIQGQQQQAQATQAGAFGGGREGIMRAERERALGDTQSAIMAQGMQSAFDRAQNQYNTGFGQQMGLSQLQSQYGGQQQQLEQQKINQQIQDYATAQQYPMMQLGNMSALLRGLPMQSSTTSIYQAAPSAMSQLAGLGTAAYGLSQLGGTGAKAAKGGSTKDIQKRPSGLAELALSKMQ